MIENHREILSADVAEWRRGMELNKALQTLPFPFWVLRHLSQLAIGPVTKQAFHDIYQFNAITASHDSSRSSFIKSLPRKN
jgi:hypothetical protein